ncbi:MAG: hypothetical protein U9Q68_00925, partial [Euryarchaeota archaeon]|nr:hypothetical protein [Euryarchaeota archaeon]
IYATGLRLRPPRHSSPANAAYAENTPERSNQHTRLRMKKAAESGELGDLVVINLSGRGDKDVYSVAKREGF